MSIRTHSYLNEGNWISAALFSSLSVLLMLGANAVVCDIVAKSGGLSASSVNAANVSAHAVGNTSKLKSGGLSASSVNAANVTTLKNST